MYGVIRRRKERCSLFVALEQVWCVIFDAIGSYMWEWALFGIRALFRTGIRALFGISTICSVGISYCHNTVCIQQGGYPPWHTIIQYEVWYSLSQIQYDYINFSVHTCKTVMVCMISYLHNFFIFLSQSYSQWEQG